MNLRELRDTLNTLPEEMLDDFHIGHELAGEEPIERIGLVFYDDHENYDRNQGFYDLEGAKKLEKYCEKLTEDAKKIAICLIDPNKIDDYVDEYYSAMEEQVAEEASKEDEETDE